MCGLSAVLAFEANRLSLRDLGRMHELQRHRGPDGEGCLLVSRDGEARTARSNSLSETSPARLRLALAVRRLRIQDPDARADQPLGSADGTLWIALNGEIYNFRELRAELEGHGFRFRTRSDTEVVLFAYERWGVSAFERFHGMWALLIADLRRRRLVGCRDRLGIKPLFFAHEGGRWLIASEPQAIAAVQLDGPRIDPVRFPEFLCGFPPQSADRSYFDGVRPVPAGSFFEARLDDGGVAHDPRFQAYWSLPHATSEALPPFERAVEQFDDLLHNAVQREAAADVSVGTMLSGGLDSSTLTCLLAAMRPGTPALSIAYEDSGLDESGYARAVLEACGVEGHRVLVTSATLWSLTDSVIQAQGQPLLGWEVAAHFAAYGLARERGVQVVLEGHGPDEVLGGYAFHESAALREPLAELRLMRFLEGLRAAARRENTSTANALRVHVLAPFKHDLLQRMVVPRIEWLVSNGSRVKAPAPPADAAMAYPSRLNRLLYRDTLQTNLPAVLLLQDRNAMAHSVESRVPYLDHRLVEFCFGLPASYKYRGGVRKRLLHEAAARRRVPAAVLERREKRGLMADHRWFPLRNFAQPLREMARDTRLRELPWIRADRLAPVVDAYLDGRHSDSLGVWRLYTAWRWLEAFRPCAPAA